VNILEEIAGKKIQRKYYDYVKGDSLQSIPEMNNLKEEFGYVPKYSFREGLRETYNWFVANQDYFR
ncbi:MAG: hypothetical protein ACFFD4_38110, partial [Candidatus Odinarchaeota archaeon]